MSEDAVTFRPAEARTKTELRAMARKAVADWADKTPPRAETVHAECAAADEERLRQEPGAWRQEWEGRGLVWRVALLEPSRDRIAAAGLEARHFDVYRPTILRERRLAYGRRMRAPISMFPGYAFVLLRDADLPYFRMVPGVRDVLILGGRVASVAEPAMKLIRESDGSSWRGGDPRTARSAFHAGQTVRIKTGNLFEDHIGEIARLDSDARIVVLLSLFGRETPVMLSDHDVEPAV